MDLWHFWQEEHLMELQDKRFWQMVDGPLWENHSKYKKIRG